MASTAGAAGLAPTLSAAALLKHVPELATVAQLETIDVMSIDSTNMTPAAWLTVAAALEGIYEKYDGFVVCHGTDTLSYTAAALSYLVQRSPKPIVLTGSQRPIELDSTDAKQNLFDAVVVAASGVLPGVSVVFDGNVIAGTRARKERTHSYNAFSSLNFPVLGVVQNGRLLPYVLPRAACGASVDAAAAGIAASPAAPAEKNLDGAKFSLGAKSRFHEEGAASAAAAPHFSHELETNVGALKLTPTTTSRTLAWMLEAYDALVIESFGMGGLPQTAVLDAPTLIREACERGRTVVIATQVPLEGSNSGLYEVGHGITGVEGVLEAFDMTLEASLCKLMWILARTRNPREVRDLFHTTINYDTLYSW
jgi:L-asparaginase